MMKDSFYFYLPIMIGGQKAAEIEGICTVALTSEGWQLSFELFNADSVKIEAPEPLWISQANDFCWKQHKKDILAHIAAIKERSQA